MRSLLVTLMLLTGPAVASDIDRTMPDPMLTPGAVETVVDEEGLPRPLTLAEICARSTRDKGVRDVSNAKKQEVRRRYGMTGKRDLWCNAERACEIDHLIPLALGGSNAVTNLWPEAYDGVWSAEDKDRLETEAKKRVCSGRLDLAEAQTGFSMNWKTLYVQVFKSIPAGSEP